MFTESQIEFMKANGIHVNFNHPSSEDYIYIEDAIGTIYTDECILHPTENTKKILMCESILNELA